MNRLREKSDISRLLEGSSRPAGPARAPGPRPGRGPGPRSGQLEVQLSVGAALLPLYSAWKPNVVLDPPEIWALNEALSAVTWAPLWVSVVFQALVIFWLPAQSQATCHVLVAALPVLATVTVAVNPVPQSLSTWYVALHPAPCGGGDVGGGEVGGGVLLFSGGKALASSCWNCAENQCPASGEFGSAPVLLKPLRALPP